MFHTTKADRRLTGNNELGGCLLISDGQADFARVVQRAVLDLQTVVEVVRFQFVLVVRSGDDLVSDLPDDVLVRFGQLAGERGRLRHQRFGARQRLQQFDRSF